MSWVILITVVAMLVVALFALRARRDALEVMIAGVEQRTLARERGSDRARLQYPHLDLSRCIGCGSCVAACPEEGVLEVIHGQAVVAHGARCVGHGRCAVECPVGAIAVTLGDLENRRDLPVIGDDFEVVGTPGLFLAGEVTGFALIRTAIAHGTAVAREVKARLESRRNGFAPEVSDLCIVGAGPAGIACALEAKANGLRAVTIDQEALGGAVSKYPRRKLVMTQPVDLPLHGRLDRTSYRKEELMELWAGLVERHELDVRTGCEFQGLRRTGDGGFELSTSLGPLRARHVCLALGRRGTPRKLGVPGEELPKVTYSLVDAVSYNDRRIVVVGGGDSAVEAAIGLAEQPGNEVVLSYRKDSFTRLKARNEARVHSAISRGQLSCLYRSEVRHIGIEHVELEVDAVENESRLRLPNDDVFVFAGGTPPFPLLESCGVSFDPSRRPAPEAIVERGTGLLRSLGLALVLALLVLGWTLVFSDYYSLAPYQRAASDAHCWLRLAGPAGLAFGVTATAMILTNLAYLARRSTWIRFEWGALQTWMSAHLLTGILALLCVIPHASMAPCNTVGGHAFLALLLLVVTGSIGRYFYAFVPRAANGRELELDEVRQRLARLAGEWDRVLPTFARRVREEIEVSIGERQWRSNLASRVLALLTGERKLRRMLARLRREAQGEGMPAEQIDEVLSLASRGHRAALGAAHLEDLRGLIASWRYFHRWVALLMVLLIVVHVVTALRYAGFGSGSLR